MLKPANLRVAKNLNICEWCTVQFAAKPSLKRRFCSRICWKSFYDENRTFECTYCHKNYQIPKEGKPPKGKPFCSTECWNKYQTGKNNSAWKGSKSDVTCNVCEKKFSIKTLKRRSTARYCSVACRTIDYQKNGYPKDTRSTTKCCGCDKYIM